MKDIKKEKREMIEEIIIMDNFIYNDMLKNLDSVDYCDLLRKYEESCLIYRLLRLKGDIYDRNCR